MNAVTCCLTTWLLLAQVNPAPPQDYCQGLLDDAADTYAGGDFAAAAEVYESIVELCGPSPRILVYWGEALQAVGDDARALNVLAQGIEQGPWQWTAAMGHYYRARVCSRLGCISDAHDSIAMLASRFPDSIWTARSEAVEAELDGLDLRPVLARLEREEIARVLLEDARAEIAAGAEAAGLELLAEIIENYADTRTSLEALASEGHVLSRDRARDAVTLEAFEALFEEVNAAWPDALITYTTGRSLGHMYQRHDRPEDALAVFNLLATRTDDAAMAAYALVQAGGAHFEVLQKRRALGGTVEPAEWDALRDHLREVHFNSNATVLDRSRADLMIAETYHWEMRRDETLAATLEYLGTYDFDDDPSGVGTAHLFAGIALRHLGRYSEALDEFNWIIDTYQDQDIWPNQSAVVGGRPNYCASVAQALYWRVDVLYHSGAPPKVILALADEIIARYPESPFAELARRGNEQVLNEIEAADNE